MSLTQYRRNPHEESPFPEKPSGSEWQEEHLRWLRVDLEHDCAPGNIVSEPRLLPSCQVVRYLLTHLDLPWDEIRRPDADFPPESFYSGLRYLGSVPSPLKQYERSSPPEEFGSSPPRYLSKLSVSQSAMDTENEVVHSRDADSSPSIRRSGPSSHSRSVTQSSRRPKADVTGGPIPFPSLSPTRKTFTAFPPGPSMPSPSRPRGVRRDNTFSSTPSPTLPPLPSNWSPDRMSDSTYLPSSSSPVKLGRSTNSAMEDKIEEEVRLMAVDFFHVIESAIKSLKLDLMTQVKSPSPLIIMVDGDTMTTRPDLTLRIRTKAIEVNVMVECKRKLHVLREDQILGQEVSEMLALAQRYKSFIDDKPQYTTYLISWHHLNCYVSRLDVSNEYLDQLALESGDLNESLSVKRSRVYHIKNGEERVQLALTIAEIAILELDSYNRARGLVRTLCNA